MPPSDTTGPTVALDPAWWVRGLALHERMTGCPDVSSVDGGRLDAARQRLARWRAEHGVGLSHRLAEFALNEDAFLVLDAVDRTSLAARIRRPDWAEAVERAIQVAAPPSKPLPTDWRSAFALPVRPFVTGAVDQLSEEAGQIVPPGWIDLESVANDFGERLSRRLVAIAARTLVSELHLRRTANQLTGNDSRARFNDFVRQLADPAGLAVLVTRYPVLARLLGQASLLATEATLELLTRFVADRSELVGLLLGGADPGRLTMLVHNQGDAHRRGRSTTMVHFADSRRVVYKPRDVESQVRLNTLIGGLNRAAPSLGLRSLATVVRSGYGWSEYVANVPLTDPGEADLFYRRQGALLALLHVLHSTDIHCENLIACGDQPIVVDVETLFHPALTESTSTGDPAADMLAASVHRTGLLPLIVVGEQGIMDLSGVGGDRGRIAPNSTIDWVDPGTDRMRLTRRAAAFDGALNRPRLGDDEIDPGAHEAAMLDGFRLAYDAIVAQRPEFTKLLDACAGIEVRIVARPTWLYQTLLDEATHPDVLRDGLDRDAMFGVLWKGVESSPTLAQFARHEVVALWDGDVPLFSGRPGSPEVVAADGQRLPVPLRRTGLDTALAKIAALDEVDRQDQEWIISATLATRRPADGHRSIGPILEPVTGTAAQPDQLLAAACAVADQIVARGIPHAGRVNWLGLELVDDRQWLVLPMGAGLANGYIGVALFLGQLAELSGIPRYSEVAHHAISAVPRWYRLLDTRPELISAIGCGGLYGFGGVAYGLARLATLLADTDVRDWARTAVELAEVAAPTTPAAGWANGIAGCLAAMTAVHAELGLDSAASLAGRCADRLVELIQRNDMPTTAGFADGTAGISWALARCAASNDPRYARAGSDAVRQAARQQTGQHPQEYGWCCGAAGLALARSCLTNSADRHGHDGTLEDVRLLADRPVLRDLSLCHGELGIAETLTVLAAAAGGATAARRRRAGLVLDAFQWYGPACGTPGGLFTPGLLTGLAGIGYGLLRLGLAERVPSALLLEPTPRSVSQR